MNWVRGNSVRIELADPKGRSRMAVALSVMGVSRSRTELSMMNSSPAPSGRGAHHNSRPGAVSPDELDRLLQARANIAAGKFQPQSSSNIISKRISDLLQTSSEAPKEQKRPARQNGFGPNVSLLEIEEKTPVTFKGRQLHGRFGMSSSVTPQTLPASTSLSESLQAIQIGVNAREPPADDKKSTESAIMDTPDDPLMSSTGMLPRASQGQPSPAPASKRNPKNGQERVPSIPRLHPLRRSGSYPDPMSNAPPTFLARINEIAQFEVETVRYERMKKLRARKNGKVEIKTGD